MSLQPSSRAATACCCVIGRQTGEYPDVWDLPGGHVEDGERPEQALRRDLTEEIGVDVGVVADAPVLHLIDDSTGFDLIVWHVTSWAGTVQNRHPEEHDEVSWLAETELRDLNYADKGYLNCQPSRNSLLAEFSRHAIP